MKYTSYGSFVKKHYQTNGDQYKKETVKQIFNGLKKEKKKK